MIDFKRKMENKLLKEKEESEKLSNIMELANEIKKGSEAGDLAFSITTSTGTSFGTSVTSTSGTFYTPLSSIEMIKLVEYNESIEIIYKETPSVTLYSGISETKCFKIIFSCKDGKFHKSERIYGKINKPTKESYEFD